ncbi:MAG: tetratricopeptide repeat protein [Kiritimatiellae bacterium]|nr:tetratricopeptide repeat protein [Kiritimatiellia bacterium]
MSKNIFLHVGSIILMCMSGSANTAIRKQLFDRIQALKTTVDVSSNTVRRFQWHILAPDDLNAAVKGYTSIVDFDQELDPQLGIRLRILSGKITDLNIKGEMFQHRNSPSILTLLGDAISDPASCEANPWGVAYAQDNNWLPAIIGLIKTYRREEIIAARYASQGLEFVEPHSREAQLVLQQLSHAFKFQSDCPTEVARGILKKLNAKAWPKDAQWTKDRLEAALLFHSDEQQEALKLYLKIIVSNNKSDAMFYRVAGIYASQGRISEASEVLRDGLQAFPHSSVLLVKSATDCFCSNHDEAALTQINKCLDASPEYPPAHILKARMLVKTGKKKQAVESCLNSLRFSHGWATDFITPVNEVIRQIENN